MNRNFLFSLIFLLVGILLGFGVGRLGGADQQLLQEIQKLQAQIAQARKILPVTPTDMRNVWGVVASVSANAFTLDVPSFNPFDDFAKTRTVTIGANTKIILAKQKDQTQYQKEVTAYQESIRNGTYSKNPVASPVPVEETAGAFSDIKKGQSVSVNADHNIRDEQSFTATEVRVYVSSGNK